MNQGRIIIISAPSGTGKSTVISALRKKMPKLFFSVSCTTRPIREGEKDGREYFYVDQKKFKKMISDDSFAEWAKVHNEYYGTCAQQITETTSKGLDILLDIDVQGAMQIKKRFPEAISIFLTPPSMEELERRLKKRGTETDAQVRLRLKNAQKELSFKDSYNFVVVNKDAMKTVDELLKILVNFRKFR